MTKPPSSWLPKLPIIEEELPCVLVLRWQSWGNTSSESSLGRVPNPIGSLPPSGWYKVEQIALLELGHNHSNFLARAKCPPERLYSSRYHRTPKNKVLLPPAKEALGDVVWQTFEEGQPIALLPLQSKKWTVACFLFPRFISSFGAELCEACEFVSIKKCSFIKAFYSYAAQRDKRMEPPNPSQFSVARCVHERSADPTRPSQRYHEAPCNRTR